MATRPNNPDTATWRDLTLGGGEQAVINGALLSADTPVHLRVGSGASVLRGRARDSDTPATTAARELYYESMLLASRAMPLSSESVRMFQLLGRCVLHTRSREAQAECTSYAAAMQSGDDDRALAAAQHLVSLAASKPAGAWTRSLRPPSSDAPDKPLGPNP